MPGRRRQSKIGGTIYRTGNAHPYLVNQHARRRCENGRTEEDTVDSPCVNQCHVAHMKENDPISGKLSRRRLLQLAIGSAAVTAATGLLAACGDDDDDDDTTEAQSTTSPQGPGVTPPTPEVDATEEAEDTTPEGEDEPAAGEAGGELIVGLSADPPNLDPHVGTGFAAVAVKLQFYNGLTRHWAEDGQYELQLDLAESIEISDDGLTITVHLRDGVLFHDGSPFTSADVEATIARIQDESTGASRQLEMSEIESIELPDELTVVLHMAAPNAAMLTHFANESSLMMSKKFIESGGVPDLDVVGTGPFKLESREPGVRIECVRNEDYYHEGRPLLERVTFIPYPDEDTRVTAILSGDVDFIDYVPWKDYERIEQNADLQLMSGGGAAFMYVIYNLNHPPFDDPAVRYALSFAYDRQAVVDIAFHGKGAPITGGLIPPGFWGHHEGIEGHFSYDPERARHLLAEAGYPDGFGVTLMSTSQYSMHQDTAEVVQANLRDIGVDCELELFDWTTVTERDARGDFQFRIQGTGTGEGDPDNLASFYHSQSPGPRRFGFGDPEIDDLLERAKALVDVEERKPLYDELQERLLTLQPITYICYRDQAHAATNAVSGFEHFPGGVFQYSASTFEKVAINRG